MYACVCVLIGEGRLKCEGCLIYFVFFFTDKERGEGEVWLG